MGGAEILVFSLAVSADGFLAGLAYGVRGLRIGWASLLAISLASLAMMSGSLFAGAQVEAWLESGRAKVLGAVLLAIVGGCICLEAWLKTTAPSGAPKPLIRWRISSLGLVIQVLREPTRADLDSSGTLNLAEAGLLGLALALDAFGVGLGAGLTGLGSWKLPVAVAGGNLALVPAGSWIGRRYGPRKLGEKGGLVPGLLLIGFALWQVLRGGV